VDLLPLFRLLNGARLYPPTGRLEDDRSRDVLRSVLYVHGTDVQNPAQNFTMASVISRQTIKLRRVSSSWILVKKVEKSRELNQCD
jgi:hypothetical protein